MASSGRVMEKPVLQEQQALKCPRCDSSNTKFCYYNNYSLSQPRHFCKACKRYWTRGGTLRNVPVGGGYRKNKKVKKSGGGVGLGGGGGSGSDTTHTPLSQQIHASTSTSHINQLLYGLPSNSSFSNFPFQRFNSRNSNGEEGIAQTYNGYNHQSQLSGLGLSFPSSSSMNREEHDYGAGFTHNNTQVQDLSLLGTSNYASYATNSSLIASSLQKQKQVWNGMKETSFQSLLPFQNLQMGSSGEAAMVMDLVKSEEGKDNRPIAHRMEWRVPSETHVEPLGSLDSSLYNWNSASVATWPDLANYGPSVTPLI